MRRDAAALVLAAAGGLAACAGDPDPAPCDLSTAGAAWVALGSAETGDWNVQIARADGTCRRSITSDPAADLHPAWSRDGRLAYDSDRAPGSSVWIQTVATGEEHRLDVGALRATSPAFSPDGGTIAFEGREPGATTGGIYVVSAGGGTPTLLTPEAVPHSNGGAAFSPDGASVFFVSNRTGPYEIFRVAASGGDAVQVTTGSRVIGKPSVSPDGRSLAFARTAGTSTEVVLYDLGAATTTPLPLADASEPAFDPAGGRLVARVFHGIASGVEVVRLDGLNPTPVTSGDGPFGSPAFAPRG